MRAWAPNNLRLLSRLIHHHHLLRKFLGHEKVKASVLVSEVRCHLIRFFSALSTEFITISILSITPLSPPAAALSFPSSEVSLTQKGQSLYVLADEVHCHLINFLAL